MMRLNLQFFGGRGSGGGKGSGGGGKLTEYTKPMMEAFEKVMPTGVYAMKGAPEETLDVSYKQANEFAVEMYVSGQSVVKMYQQYEGEWRVEDYTTGVTRGFNSPSAAAKSVRASLSEYRKVRTKK